MHNALIVSPTEMHQSAVMVITNYAGSISDSSLLPPTDSDTARSTLKRTKQSGTGGRGGGMDGQSEWLEEGMEQCWRAREGMEGKRGRRWGG